MRAIVQTAPGEPGQVLALKDLAPPPSLAPNDVLIEVKLASVHHGDLHLIRSLPGIPEQPGYLRRGSEAVGVVRAVGQEVARKGEIKAGARVVGFPAIGSWAEQVVVPSHWVIAISDDLEDHVAAQLFINYVTARMILRGLRKTVSDEVLKKGSVLVTGASTVVGRLLLHFLSREGWHPIGLARSQQSAQRVQAELSGVPVVPRADEDWNARIAAVAADRPIVGVTDCVSGTLLGELASLLADDCGIVTYGDLGGGPIGLTGFQITDHQFVIRGVTFFRWFTEVPREEQSADLAAAVALARELPSLFAAGNVFKLDDFQAAIAAVEQPDRTGFVFLKPH